MGGRVATDPPIDRVERDREKRLAGSLVGADLAVVECLVAPRQRIAGDVHRVPVPQRRGKGHSGRGLGTQGLQERADRDQREQEQQQVDS